MNQQLVVSLWRWNINLSLATITIRNTSTKHRRLLLLLLLMVRWSNRNWWSMLLHTGGKINRSILRIGYRKTIGLQNFLMISIAQEKNNTRFIRDSRYFSFIISSIIPIFSQTSIAIFPIPIVTGYHTECRWGMRWRSNALWYHIGGRCGERLRGHMHSRWRWARKELMLRNGGWDLRRWWRWLASRDDTLALEQSKGEFIGLFGLEADYFAWIVIETIWQGSESLLQLLAC